eukprot:GHVN01073779.1.p1 GENE.GHVN01073779.1~~GHVN01073779.1.p1  ORF type:complete len:669 (+),score=64.69 GHVN01073779.1:236-2008(+)
MQMPHQLALGMGPIAQGSVPIKPLETRRRSQDISGASQAGQTGQAAGQASARATQGQSQQQYGGVGSNANPLFMSAQGTPAYPPHLLAAAQQAQQQYILAHNLRSGMMPLGYPTSVYASGPGSAPTMGAQPAGFNPAAYQQQQQLMQAGMIPGGMHQAHLQYLQSHLPMRQRLTMRDIGDLRVSYFNMGKFVGRGGALRFFLLGKQIKHKFDNVLIEEWPQRKQQLLDSGEYPLGQLPTMKHNGRAMFETIPILRYLAKKIGEYGTNHFNDYITDLMCERVAYWRDEIMVTIGERGEDTQTFEHYIAIRKSQYELFETLLTHVSPPKGNGFAAVDTTTASTERSNVTNTEVEGSAEVGANRQRGGPQRLTFCDFALYSCIYDDLKLIEMTASNNAPLGANFLETHSRVKALFDEVHSLPLILDWREEMDTLLNQKEGEPREGDTSNMFTPRLPGQDASALTEHGDQQPETSQNQAPSLHTSPFGSQQQQIAQRQAIAQQQFHAQQLAVASNATRAVAAAGVPATSLPHMMVGYPGAYHGFGVGVHPGGNNQANTVGNVYDNQEPDSEGVMGPSDTHRSGRNPSAGPDTPN